MLQYHLINRFSGLLRWYRTSLLIDMKYLSTYLPVKGRLLDVGCGVGSVDYELGRRHPAMRVLGIDITPASIEWAKRRHALPNVEYACQRLETIAGHFDCVLFIDVFHHVPPEHRDSFLQAAARLLAPGGYVLIKDIERRHGWCSWALDRYVSRCPANEIFLENCEDLVTLVSKSLKVVKSEVRFRVPFPHYYIKATRKGF